MTKPKYVKARLILKPTPSASDEMEKAGEGIPSQLAGTLVLSGWKNESGSQLEVAGSIESKATSAKPKKAMARRARK